MMGLDIWFKDDLKNILAAQLLAVAKTETSDEYWRGYQDCAANLAVALGIEVKREDERLPLPLR